MSSFEEKTISEVLKLRESGLVKQEEVSKMAGKDAVRIIFNRLDSAFTPLTDIKVIKF